MAKRILYIVPHRLNRSPGQRFRCEHFIPILEKEGYEITYSNLLSAWDDVHFYKRGYYIVKLFIFLKSFFIRCFDVCRAFRYDAIFIYREAFMVGTTCFERALQFSGTPILYDFDDSIWLTDTSNGNQNLEWLKNAKKTDTIISLSKLVVVGNQYLANYSLQFNSNVVVIPTTIDTDYHIPTQKIPQNQVCIGWTGTETTLRHFRILEPVLEKIKLKYGNAVSFKQISNTVYENENLQLISIPWSVETEIEELQKIDIGIMPLPDDEWAQGKCGFKGLQYMSLEIPTMMSPVGVNTEIIEHGKNGFLACNDTEWETQLCNLIENKELRQTIGTAGRQTIIERYSINSQKEKYVQLFDKLTNKR
jgi:glycosyltransferase involved in cell wall biosynthesis